MRKILPNPFLYYLKRALMVAAVPYFIYCNYKIYEAYSVVQQRKIDRKKNIEGEKNTATENEEKSRTGSTTTPGSPPVGKSSSAAENIRVRVSQLEERSKSLPATTKQ